MSDKFPQLRERILAESKSRAAVMEQVADHTQTIAALCKDAVDDGVPLTELAKMVQIPDKKTGVLRPVTRQAIEQMLAAHFGRAPTRPRVAKPPASSTIDMTMFS